MMLETNRMLSDRFADATSGFNALLASTPRDAGDASPAALATITDQTRDGNVARGELPATLPALAISVDGIPQLDGQVATVTRDGKIRVRIRVGFRNAVTANGHQVLSYYLRTAQRVLRRFFDLDPSQRGRNGIYLETIDEMVVAETWSPTEADIVTGTIVATIQGRDTVP